MLPSVSFETEIFDQGSSGSGEFVAHTHTMRRAGIALLVARGSRASRG